MTFGGEAKYYIGIFSKLQQQKMFRWDLCDLVTLYVLYIVFCLGHVSALNCQCLEKSCQLFSPEQNVFYVLLSDWILPVGCQGFHKKPYVHTWE